MESKRQVVNITGNKNGFINLEPTNHSSDSITEEKNNQETPHNQSSFPNHENNFIFINSNNSNNNQTKNYESENLTNKKKEKNIDEIIYSSSQNQNQNLNLNNFLLKKKREVGDFDEERKNFLETNQMTEEKNTKKNNKITRLVVTKIKSSNKDFVAKSRLGNINEDPNENYDNNKNEKDNENKYEINNINRQRFLQRLNSANSSYSVNCPMDNYKNQNNNSNRFYLNNLENQYVNINKKDTFLNLNENENENADQNNYGNFF